MVNKEREKVLVYSDKISSSSSSNSLCIWLAWTSADLGSRGFTAGDLVFGMVT